MVLTLREATCYVALVMQIPKRQSIVEQTAAILRKRFAASHAGAMVPGERELAEALEISRTTLRLALKILEREGAIRARGNRRRVIAKPQPRARARQSSRTQDIVLLSPVPLERMASPDGSFWVDHLRESLAKRNEVLHILSRPRCYSQSPGRALEALVAGVDPGAWILTFSTRPMQEWFAARRLPVVIAGSCHDGVQLPSVDRDLRAAARHAAGCFAAKGHRRVALLSMAVDTGGDVDTKEGLQEGCAAASAPVQFLDLQHDGTVDSICRSLDSALAGGNAPTALLVTAATHTLTVLTHLLRRGVDVPGDVAVISRDGDQFLTHVVPSVAHYRVDPQSYANALSRALRGIMTDGIAADRHKLLMPEFAPGATLGAG